jgi:hypothetical protein
VADQPAAEPTDATRGQPTLTAEYEQLRQIALGGHAEGWRHGLGVLATRGMTGWMNACRTATPAPVPAAPPTRGAGSHPLVEGAGELVSVMAAMALAHL